MGMKFEVCLQDGQFEIFRSTNHSSSNVYGEIIIDWDSEYGEMYSCLVGREDENGDVDYDHLDVVETFEEARRLLECHVPINIPVGA